MKEMVRGDIGRNKLGYANERDLKYLAGDISEMSFANLQKLDFNDYKL